MSNPETGAPRPSSLFPPTLLGNARSVLGGWPSTWDDTPLDAQDIVRSNANVQIAQTAPAPLRPIQPGDSPNPQGGRIGAQAAVADSYDPMSNNWRGYELVLPNGDRIVDRGLDSRSPTGNVMGPALNLHEVAAASRRDGESMRRRGWTACSDP